MCMYMYMYRYRYRYRYMYVYLSTSASVYVCTSACACECVCVCVSMRMYIRIYLSIHTQTDYIAVGIAVAAITTITTTIIIIIIIIRSPHIQQWYSWHSKSHSAKACRCVRYTYYRRNLQNPILIVKALTLPPLGREVSDHFRASQHPKPAPNHPSLRLKPLRRGPKD